MMSRNALLQESKEYQYYQTRELNFGAERRAFYIFFAREQILLKLLALIRKEEKIWGSKRS